MSLHWTGRGGHLAARGPGADDGGQLPRHAARAMSLVLHSGGGNFEFLHGGDLHTLLLADLAADGISDLLAGGQGLGAVPERYDESAIRLSAVQEVDALAPGDGDHPLDRFVGGRIPYGLRAGLKVLTLANMVFLQKKSESWRSKF